MANIATLEEFAVFLQIEPEPATAYLVLLDLAQGLVVEEIGEHDPWPTIAKAVALAAAQRAYVSPEGARRESVGGTSVEYNVPLYATGVYLTDGERTRLHRWLTGVDGTGAPTYEFPGTWPYPDPVERTADVVSG